MNKIEYEYIIQGEGCGSQTLMTGARHPEDAVRIIADMEHHHQREQQNWPFTVQIRKARSSQWKTYSVDREAIPEFIIEELGA